MEAHLLARQLGAWSTGKGPLHQKLASAITHAIRNGAVAPGFRLPSERALAQALTVSRTTVVAAYDNLRESSWLESRPGSGTRVAARVRPSSQTTHLSGSALLTMLSNHDERNLIDFALGSPHPLDELPSEFFTLPSDEYAALVRDRLYYPLGLPPLRNALAAEFTRNGLDTRPEQILVTNGAQQAIALCAGLCLQRGDTALIEDPAYFGAIDVFRATGARLVSLPVEHYGVSPSAIRDRIASTAARMVYLTPTYQNPTGVTIPAAARKEIGRIVADRGVPLVDDRTLASLVIDGHPPAPIAAYAPNADIFTIGSISKLIWPGLRIGWIRAAEPAIERLARLKSAADLGSPLLTQAIAARVIGRLDEASLLRRSQLKPRRDKLATLLRRYLPAWRFQLPGGGLFLWVELPSGDSREFAQAALRHGVTILAGPVMSAAESHTRFLRLPFFWDPETLQTGVQRLAAAWRDYRPAPRPQRLTVI